MMRLVNNDKFVRLYKVYEGINHLHLVLDYCPGGDLFERIINSKSFSEEEVSKFAKNMLEGLDYLN